MIISLIRETVEKQGIKNANQLKVALGISPTLAARLWGGRFAQVGMVTLDRLCRNLKCQPGDLLKYSSRPNRKPTTRS